MLLVQTQLSCGVCLSVESRETLYTMGGRRMAHLLLVCMVLAASLPVGLPFSSFASECCDNGDEGAIAERQALKEIRILGFIPCAQPTGNVSGCPDRAPQFEGSSDFEVCCWVDDIPILAMALDQINSDSTLLPGYRLVLDAVKSECTSTSVSAITLHDTVVKALRGDGPVHHMILGPACTVATEPVAEFSGKYINVNQVSYTASGTQFECRDRFPRLYTLQPLVFSYNDAYVHLITSFGWRRVAVIHQVDPLFSATAQNLRKKLRERNINVAYSNSIDNDPQQLLQNIKDLDLRIIIALFTPHRDLARRVWCEASKLGLTDSLHVWFTPVWATLDLSGNEAVDGCDNKDIKKARAYTFGVLGSDFVVENTSLTKLVSGQLPSTFYDQLSCYKKAFKKKYPEKDANRPVDVTFKEGYVYDSIWAIALALNRTLEDGVTLENFTYDNVTMADAMQNSLRNSDFQGISGTVRFIGNGFGSRMNETGFRSNPYLEIWQFNDTGELELRMIYNTSDQSNQSRSEIIWEDGSVPRDGPKPDPVPYPLWSVVIVSVVTGIGMVCALICLVVTVAYRKHRAFKGSTFRLNGVICIGIFLGFFGDFAYSLFVYFFLDNITVMEVVINLTNWSYHISFVLAFGGLLMKTWRIYRIFCNSALRKRKYLSDKYLLLGVGAIVAFDVVVLTVWTSAFRLMWESREENDPIDVNKKYVIYYAKTTYYFAVFLGVLLVAYVLMLLFGMFMAYQIKQNIRSFYNRYNDTPIVNLSSLLALTVSFGSLFLIILLPPTMGNVGVLLFLVALRDGSWMFPMLGLMYLPMIFELLREKITGQKIIRRGSLFSSRRFSVDSSRHRRPSSISVTSSAVDDHRRVSLQDSIGQPSSSSMDEGGWRTPRSLTTLKEEAAESIPGESVHKKTSYDVAPTNFDYDDEVFVLPRIQVLDDNSRRPSILKFPPSERSPGEERRGSHHVQFTESKQPM